MASKIEHLIKYDAYTDALAWARGSDKESIIWWLHQKTESHKGHLQALNRDKKAYRGTAPKNRLFNWLAHKFLVWAWGRESYLAITMSPDWKALAGQQALDEGPAKT